jgi:hypothetical protein
MENPPADNLEMGIVGVRGAEAVSCHVCVNEFRGRDPEGESLASCGCSKLNKKIAVFQKNKNVLDEIARIRGGKVLTTEPITLKEKWLFECSETHTWQAQGSSVKAGTWCPRCGGSYPRNLSELEKIVEERGGKLLSFEYKGVDATYSFRCNLGHEFQNMFKKVEKGQWCPTCNKGKKSEEIARVTFEHLFGVPFRKVRPTWLRNSRGRLMEIDGYSETLKIGFEYQGIQHFKNSGPYSSNLPLRIQDDELKFKLCLEQGIALFYLTYEDKYEDFPKRIKDQATQFGIDVEGIDFDSEVDLSGAYIRDDRIEELRVLLASKNIRVLSNKWLTSNAKYSLECLVCGHTWQAQGNMFFNSRRVAGCKVCAMKEIAGANKGGLQDLQDFASTFAGQCLATVYVQRRWRYKWRCAKGHLFEGNFNNMKFRNEFCPECEGRAKKELVSSNEAIQKFEEAGLVLLETYKSKRSWVKVRCEKCGTQSRQKFQNLEDGAAPCKACEHKTKNAEALDVMLAAGVQPLEPYVNVTAKWLCRCLTCQNQVTPTYVNVKRGQGACVHCGHEKTKRAVRKRASEKSSKEKN